jgi:type I restriction enzyme S subunit
MSEFKKKEPRMNTDEHGCDFLEKLLDLPAGQAGGAEVEWEALGEVAHIYGGLTGKSKKDFEDGNAKYISYKNIFKNIHINFDDLSQVRVSENENQHDVRYGDVLFTGSSETAIEAGMSSAVTRGFQEKVYLNSFSFGVRFNDRITLIPEFSKYLFRSSFMRREIATTASGVTRFNISKARFKKLLIPIPCPENPEKSLVIQAEIVRILDTFTELTARKKQYNYYRDQLLTFDLPAGRQEDGDACLPGRQVEWKTLGEVYKFQYGMGNTIPTLGGEYPVYGSNGIVGTHNEFNSEDSPVIGHIGAYAGIVNWGKGKHFVTYNGVICRLISELVSPKYAYYQLLKQDFNSMAKSASHPFVSYAELNKVLIPIPSPSEQARIVVILDKFDTLTHSISEGLPREIELRQKQYEYYRDLLLNFPKPEEVKA